MPFDSDKPNPVPGDMLEFLRPDQEDDADGQIWFGGFTPVKLLYRRVTGHRPDVLMRALKIACSTPRLHDVYDPFGWCLDKAEAELAKEREA